MFTVFPKTKTYFAHIDISPRSPHLLSHGKKIILAIARGARNIDSRPPHWRLSVRCMPTI
uniref:Globin domain-containing protein n=1 Tax=Anguilla anguilla TaxID=7936 RepID=A0A0E9XTV9_ANGAN